MACADFEEQSIRSGSEKDLEESTTEEEIKGQHGDNKLPSMKSSKQWNLVTETYCSQLQIWPTKGRHILAHYDDDTIVVYQAFKSSIAQYAVENQRYFI